MLEIFFEEAEEVVANARDSLARLADEPQHFESISTVRRAFHTLKGSSRMVGLRDFGEAAWACEQLYNARLAEVVIEADETLRGFSLQALDELERWVRALTARDAGAFHSAPLIQAANALRDGVDPDAEPSPRPAAAPVFESTAPSAAASADAELCAELEAEHQAELAAARARGAEDTEILDDEPFAMPGSDDWPEPFQPPASHASPVFDPGFDLDLPKIPTGTTVDEPIPAGVAIDADPLEFELDLSALDAAEKPAPARAENPARAVPDDGLGGEADTIQSRFDDEQETVASRFDEETDTVPAALDEASPPSAPAPLSDGRAAEPAANDGRLAEEHEPAAALEAVEPQAADQDPAAAGGDQLPADEAENYKVIGPLRIGLGLFNIFLNEADEQSRRLCTLLAEWALELPRPVGEDAVAFAHSLAGNSATVGHAELSALARRLEHALETSSSRDVDKGEALLYSDVAEEIRRLLHQFAAGFLQAPNSALLARFDALLAGIHAQAAYALQAEHDERMREMDERSQAALPPPSAQAGAVDSGGDAAPASVEFDLIEPAVEAAADEPVAAPSDDQDFADAPIAAPEVIESSAAEAADFLELTTSEAATGPRADARPAAPADEPVDEQLSAFIPEAGLGSVRFSVLDEPVRHDGGHRTGIAASDMEAPAFAQDLDAHDAIDPELFEIFTEEAHELLPTVAAHLRAWEESPETPAEAFGALRALHTLKGSARLAGAMRLGELAHRLESAFEERVGGRSATPPTMATLHLGVDALDEEFQRLQRTPRGADRPPQAVPAVVPAIVPPLLEPTPEAAAPAPAEPEVVESRAIAPEAAEPPAVEAATPAEPAAPPASESTGGQGLPKAAATSAIDWARFSATNPSRPARAVESAASNPATSTVRVRAPLLDRLVNQAGEVSITRSRLESGVVQMRSSLRELTENLDRLRRQLRDIELQADTQIASRLEASKSASVEFDPLEMDRFTRFQELTRMMAESVNDVATVQRSLQQAVQSSEDEMAAQARLTRALQDDLLRARMVPFDALSERLYRVVRQAAKETSVQVRLNVEGSAIELDRSVLDRMAGAFEHLLRNAVVHGIEDPESRRAQGKDPVGTIDVALTQQGNEVRIQVRDDGHGLDLQRIEARGRRNGLVPADARPTDAELANLIFTPGFTTAEEVTELAGRGVGMDAVRTDVTALGGRIETASAPGRGTAFTLLLPLTTAVTRVVQLRCGSLTVAVPASIVEVVRRASIAEVEQAYKTGVYRSGADEAPFFWLGALLQASTHGVLAGKTAQVVLVRSAQQRVALHVDQVVGNQEVVVKNLGPQLARLPGLAGMSLLATGDVVPIYNPVALATFYGQRPVAEGVAPKAPAVVVEVEEARAPLVLVVDDSLTVRRVTQRLLTREGFRVSVAKDGLEALEQLGVERPAVMLTDIEMPRMDGFDLLRNVRHDARWQNLPVIMITSRIAQKHRDLAMQLGADHYLGKPYDEEQLIALIQQDIARTLPA
ncbi:MAG: Hpt domain-containing protein [Burkholderiaceae bacterium]